MLVAEVVELMHQVVLLLLLLLVDPVVVEVAVLQT
jgi:hypothetical protein